VNEPNILVMVNPWARADTDTILQRFDTIGERTHTCTAQLSLDEVDALYSHVHSKQFYDSMRTELAIAPVVLALYYGKYEEAVRMKKLVRTEFTYTPSTHRRLAVHCTESEAEFCKHINIVGHNFSTRIR
jgi:hypothetical protein